MPPVVKRIDDGASRTSSRNTSLQAKQLSTRAEQQAGEQSTVVVTRMRRYQLVQPATMPVLPGQLSDCLAVEDLQKLQRALRSGIKAGQLRRSPMLLTRRPPQLPCFDAAAKCALQLLQVLHCEAV